MRMGIKDITLSSSASPVGIPTPPPLEEILQSGTQSPLSQNPMSGSILKILSENGFKQKIEEGYIKGHKYTLLHSAPSNDFTLIDTWSETKVDETGNTITVPRKKYQIFTITAPASAPVVAPTSISEVGAPEEVTIPTEAIATPSEPTASLPDVPPQTITDSEPNVSPAPSALQPVSTIDTVTATNEMLADIPTVAPTAVESDTTRAKSIAEKIKKGGAGMTPEDWQFRNENWPLIEAQLAPKAATTPTVTSSTATRPLETTPAEPAVKEITVTEQVVTKPEPEPSPAEPESLTISAQTTEPITTPNTPEVSPAPIPSDQGNPKLIPQHYDSRAWLMKKLKRTPDQAVSATAATQSSNAPATPAKASSYDLLKKRFAQNQRTENRSTETVNSSTPVATEVTPTNPAPASSSAQIPTTTIGIPTTETIPDAQSRKKNLLDSLFGTELSVWEMVKTIPARAFIYPSEYAWGTDDQGRIIEKTLEDYPLSARKFREKIAQAVEEVATQGTPIETTPVGDVIDIIFSKGIL